jgi:uncharacterized membrane protein
MKSSTDGRTTALIAYAPFVGFLIAFFINRDEKSAFATWHIKNMFGLTLFFIVSMIVQVRINVTAGDILWFLVCIVWIYCWVMAYRDKKKGIPFLSEKFQEWFAFLN